MQTPPVFTDTPAMRTNSACVRDLRQEVSHDVDLTWLRMA
jgi:hypothetical protein